jgi:hypothetical protein
MTNAIHRAFIAADEVRIGDAATKAPAKGRPITFLPSRLDANACLDLIARVDYELTIEGMTASANRQVVTVDRLDDILSYTELSLSDRMRFKTACSDFGIIPRGVPAGLGRI